MTPGEQVQLAQRLALAQLVDILDDEPEPVFQQSQVRQQLLRDQPAVQIWRRRQRLHQRRARTDPAQRAEHRQPETLLVAPSRPTATHAASTSRAASAIHDRSKTVLLLAFAGAIAARGRFSAPIGDAKVSAIDVRDIAAVAAVALTEAGHEGATYALTGPAAITHHDIAAALSAALGRDITFGDTAPEAFAASLHGILPPWQVGGLLEDYAHYRRGEAAEVTTTVADITGRAPRDIGQFARAFSA